MPSVLANGIEQAFEVVGAGPPLIMLHAATSSGSEDFAAQLPSFKPTFQCYLPAARGHGPTRWDVADGFTTDLLVADLEGFADALGLETFHPIGLSMGAMTALTFAVRRPERVRTLVVIGITAEREPRAAVARRLMDPSRIDRDDPGWAEELSRRHDGGQGEGAWRRLLPAIAADVASQPLLAPRDLRSVDGPALVVAGDRDPFCPVDHAWQLSRQLPGGHLLIGPDCGHDVPAERPALLNEACAVFYRTSEATARRRVVGNEGDER